MADAYYYERQVEHWISRDIEQYFRANGYELISFPITQMNERRVPFDFVFFSKHTNKLFALQYKALYHNGVEFWPLDAKQHRRLARFDWIYYGLAEIRAPEDTKNTLPHIRILSTDFPKVARIDARSVDYNFLDWKSFFAGLSECKYGRRIRGKTDLLRALWPWRSAHPKPPTEITDLISELFLVNFDAKRVARFSNVQRQMTR